MLGQPVRLQPLEVIVEENNLEKALKKLKRKLATEGVLKELKRRRRYAKPSEKRKKKMADAARRRRKRMKKATQ